VFERFTEKAIKVIMLAQEESRRMGHNFVGAEQILLGLCGEGTGLAARVLRAHNVKLKDLRATVLGIIGKGSGNVSVEIPFTPRAKKLLEAAWNAARDLGHDYVGTEHLLLGLLAVDGGVAKQALDKHKVDLEKVKIDVLDFIQIANKQQQMGSANPAHAPANLPPLSHSPIQSDPLVESGVAVKSQALVRSAKGPVASQSAKAQVAKSNVSDLFSQLAIIAMQLAQQEARRVGSMKLELQHLLLGILAEGSSEAARLLSGQSIALEELRLATTQEEVEKPTESQSLDFELSKQVLFTVEMASVAARTSGSSLIAPEHLLLSLLSYEESRAVKGLQKLGVNIELFVDELRKVIKALSVAQEKVAAEEKTAESAKADSPVVEAEQKLDKTAAEEEKKVETADLLQSTLALTTMVEHAISLAREEAHRLGHAEVDTDHVLLGLMTEVDGLASLALHVWDVKTKELRQESENMPGREKCDSPCESKCGSKVNELILAARQLAREAKRTYVGTDHVLLALLADEESAGLKVLRNLSIDLDRLKKMLQRANTPPQLGAKYSALVPLSKQKGFERFSDEAIKALTFAKEEASRLGHSQIDSQFLLLGICDERLNKGAERLRKIGISLDDLRFEVEHLTGHGEGDCGSEIVFGEHSLQAMCWSFDTVVASGVEVIRPEHLFVGIILEESGPASALLKQFNVSIERLRANTALKLKKRKLDPLAVSGVEAVRLLLESGYASVCELLSRGAIDAILDGKLEAQSFSQELLEPCHILLGLLSQPSGLAARAAAITGLSIDRLRMGIQRLNGSVVSRRQRVIVSQLTKNALVEARVMAELCNSAEIESDHLLIGILKDHSCLKLFSDLGYDYKDYRETVLLLLKANHPSLFPSEATVQSVSGDPTVATIPAVSSPPPFSKLTDTDIDKLFGRATGSTDKLVMRVFTSTAQNVIRLAVNEARRLKRAQVGTDHLLVGILSGQDSVAATALEAIGITRSSLRTAIEKEFGVVDSPAAGDLPFSKNAILAFEKAFESAQSFGSSTIGVDQLLIGILGLQRIVDYGSLSREDCAGVTILRSLGVDLGYLRRLVIDRMTPSNSTAGRLGFNADSTPTEVQPLPQSKRFTYSEAAIKRFDNFAADALKAVLIAHEVARENRLSLVGTEQILVAMVLDTEGKAGAILKDLRVTAERVRAEIDRFVQTGSNISHGGEPYTTEAISVFNRARRGADFVEGKVGTEHLLLSIISNQRHLACIILGRAGIDVEKLQEIMAEEQTALSEFVEKAAAAKRSGEAISELIPVVDYQAALIESGNQSQVLGQEPGLESVCEMFEGLTHEEKCDQNEGDWAALKERFTANLRTVIDMAKTDSCNRNKGIVDAPQLLYALFNLHTNSCANHLKVLNLDRFALRDRLGQILHVTDPRAASAFVGFSALADQVLLRAFQLSAFEGVGWVQTRHLLLALIESEDEKFVPFMTAIGLRPDVFVGGSNLKSATHSEPAPAYTLSQTALNQDALGVTATAERVMKLAADEAKQMGHNFVGTEQIMLGLIGAGDGVAGQLLLSHGLTLLELRRRVKEIIGEGPCVAGAELPFTPRTKRMLDLALNEAQRLKHDEIGTGHILLGLLREGHGVAARVLKDMGLSLNKLIEETEARLLEDGAKKTVSSSANDSVVSTGDFER